MADVADIETIVVVMLENRSFDNVLGHLSHPRFGARPDVDGLLDPEHTADYDNFHDKQAYKPFATADKPFRHDLPHKRATIARQIEVVNGQATMAGFVQSYVDETHHVVRKSPPMGFLRPRGVPISGYLAAEYLTCDRWFSPLPTGTQPNRAMAFTGTSLIDDNVIGLIPHDELVFDWLDRHGVPWRVYHSGLSFFLLFGALGHVLGPRFRSFRHLATDFQSETGPDAPKVIFVEPAYEDSPVHLGSAPNDNHPPLPMAPGEAFVREVYTALRSNEARWQKTLLVVDYDEHGGFYDHVPPEAIQLEPGPGTRFERAFERTGVRVPALVASPLVDRAAVCSATLDHTSVLQLLAERFAGGARSYSPAVNARLDQGIASLSAVLRAGPARSDRPTPPPAPIVAVGSAQRDPSAPPTENQRAFAAAARHCLDSDRAGALERFPELALLPRPGP